MPHPAAKTANPLLRLAASDPVAVAARDIAAGETVVLDGVLFTRNGGFNANWFSLPIRSSSV